MDNFNKDDAFFDTVNRNNAASKREEQVISEIAQNVDRYYRNIARARAATKRDAARKREKDRRDAIKAMAVAGAIVAVLAAGVTINIIHGEEIEHKISEHNDYNNAVNILKYNMSMVFTARNMAYGGTLNRNSLQQYRDINLNSPEEIYMLRYEMSYRNADNFEEEFNKIMRSISYYNSEGELCHYADFEDYLKVSGIDEKEFKEFVRNKIIERYRANDINEIPYEGFSTTNMPKPVTLKGGR